MSNQQIKLIIRISGLIVFLATLLCLLIIDINFSGHHEIIYQPGQTSSQTSLLFPESRVVLSDNTSHIIDEPVYFTTRMSNMYDNVRILVSYENKCCQSVFVGLRSNSTAWNYDLNLLDNTDYNNLSWASVNIDSIVLWSKNIIKTDLSDILTSVSSNNKVAVYNFSESPDYIIDDYTDYRSNETYLVNILGLYTMYVYVDEKIDLEFIFNQADDIDYFIYDAGGNMILQYSSTDSVYNLNIDDLKSGIYRIVVSPQVKTTTNSISSTNKYINFANQLDLVGGEFSIVTDASTLRWLAADASGLQTIKYGDNVLSIDEINNKYYSRDLDRKTYLEIPNGHITVFGDGLFSFNDDYLLPTIPGKTTRIFDDSDYDYLIAKYKRPTSKDGTTFNEVEFALDEAAINNGKLRFVIGALGANIDNPLIIKNIKVLYDKKNDQDGLWSDFVDYLKYWYKFVR